MEEPTITFYPSGLVSKFGFDDGDILFDLLDEHGYLDEDGPNLDQHDVLIAVVERLLVPQLDQEVETYTIGATLHNPIRAGKVDGEDADLGSDFTPEIVEIPVAAILEVAESLAGPTGEERWARV